VVFAGKSSFGTVFPQDLISLDIQRSFPFFVGFTHFSGGICGQQNFFISGLAESVLAVAE
jgi:hypothetical protein